MKYHCILLLQFAFVLNLSGQLWTKTHDLGASESGYTINAHEDGGFLISGREWSQENNYSNFLFSKVDSEGDLIWTKNYKFPGYDVGSRRYFTFAPKESTGYYVIGNTYDLLSSDSFSDIFIIRLSESGDTLWSKAIGTDATELLTGALMTEDEKFVFLHSSHTSENQIRKYFLTKVDINGDLIWSNEFFMSSPSQFYTLKEGNNGNFIASGYQRDIDNQFDAVVANIDSSGHVVWERIYGETGDPDLFFDMKISKNGNPLFFGSTRSFGTSGFYIVETDWNGNVLLEKLIPGPNGGVVFIPGPRNRALTLSNGNYVVVTSEDIQNGGADDSQLFWFDSNLNLMGSEIFGEPFKRDNIYALTHNSEDEILLVGDIYEASEEETDILLVKYAKDYLSSVSKVVTNPKIKVYPSPFDQFFNLEVSESIKLPLKFEILSLNGSIVYSGQVNSNQISIKPNLDIDGVYFLKIFNDQWTEKYKILKFNY